MRDTKDIITLIASYIIVTDQAIDNKELDIVYDYNQDIETVKKEMNDIFSDSPEKIPFKSLLDELSQSSQEHIYEAYNLFLNVIYSDGYFDKEEKAILDKIKQNVPIDEIGFTQLESRVASNIRLYSTKEDKTFDGVKLKFYSFMGAVTPTKSNVFTDKKKEILLNGPHFVKKIKEISRYAYYDLKFSEKILNETSKRISTLLDQIASSSQKLKKSNRKDKELLTFIDTLQTLTRDQASAQLKENIEVLNKKRRSIDYFTISFLGRTKAGKSTLHSIITKEGDEAIGIGKVRTTRFNRVYNWDNLRIIDTPGIGAPNGQDDVDIAASIVDESDLICYIVTNDAIQETEFKFLSEIKKKNKPVLILLNVKENIENERRRTLFLKKPLKWKTRTDNKTIQGHIDRVNEYMTKYYSNNYYKVIPVMLLAAKLSEVEEDVDIKKKLYEASNINEFLTCLKDSVFENGHIRKSQNIIDGSNVRLNSIYEGFSKEYNSVDRLITKLKSEKDIFNSYLSKNQPIFHKNLVGIVNKKKMDLEKFARDFSINNYNLNKAEVEQKWKIELESRGFVKQLENELISKYDNIQEEIRTRLEESLDSFQLMFNNISFNVETSSTFNTQKAIGIGAGVLGVVGSIVLLSNPIGWAFVGASVLFGLAAGLFKSKEKKIKEAQQKIEESLMSCIHNMDKQYKEKVNKQLDLIINSYRQVANKNLGELIDNASVVRVQLNAELRSNKKNIDTLNKAIMVRTLQHNKNIPFDEDINKALCEDKSIITVDRCFNSNKITLTSTHKLKPTEISKISELIQADFNNKN